MIWIALGLVLIVGGIAGLNLSLRLSAMALSTLSVLMGLYFVVYGVIQIAGGNL